MLVVSPEVLVWCRFCVAGQLCQRAIVMAIILPLLLDVIETHQTADRCPAITCQGRRHPRRHQSAREYEEWVQSADDCQMCGDGPTKQAQLSSFSDDTRVVPAGHMQ